MPIGPWKSGIIVMRVATAEFDSRPEVNVSLAFPKLRCLQEQAQLSLELMVATFDTEKLLRPITKRGISINTASVGDLF